MYRACLALAFMTMACLYLASCLTFTPLSERPVTGEPSPDVTAQKPEVQEKVGATGYLLSNRISSLAVDSRYVWVGTDRGLSRCMKKQQNWDGFTVKDGLAHNNVLSIALDGDLDDTFSFHHA